VPDEYAEVNTAAVYAYAFDNTLDYIADS